MPGSLRFTARALGAVGLCLAAPAWAQGTSSVLLAPVFFMIVGAALAVAVALAVLAWVHRGKDEREALRAERESSARLRSLVEGWVWRTDAQHRLSAVHAADDALASGVRPEGQELWSLFRGDDAQALRARMQSQDAFNDVRALGPGLLARSAQAQWLLRARPCRDASGAFAGFEGSARLLGPTIDGTAAPAQDATPVSAPSAPEAFTYTVSHDLRAPIRVVEGFTKILKEDYGRMLDRVGNDHLDRVLGAAARMNSMIDALLALSRLGAQPLTRQPVNLSQLAAFVVEDMRREQPQRQVEVRIAPDLQATGDPTLLRVLLENLLGNAWKYSAHREGARIDFGEVHADGRHAFCVADNGAGFDMRFADRLFGVFQRLHSASEFPGTGVGLASVRRIVQRHHGDIWAESAPDQGARFYFTLPR